MGVYAFRPAALARFAALPPGELEREESLEQLRWLEAGGRIRVVPACYSPRGIDTAADYAAFVARRRVAEGEPPRAARANPEEGPLPARSRDDEKDRVST